MSDAMNRRAALGSIVAAGALLAAPRIAAAADLEADPIFAAIERHKAARDRYCGVVDLTDEVLAREQGRAVTAADRATCSAASDAEINELLAAISTPPQTAGGARAILEYIKPLDMDLEIGAAAFPALVSALLRSPLIAA